MTPQKWMSVSTSVQGQFIYSVSFFLFLPQMKLPSFDIMMNLASCETLPSQQVENGKCIQTDRCNTSPGSLDLSEQAENGKYSPTLVTCYIFLHALCDVSSATSSLSRMVSSDFGSVVRCKSILFPLIPYCTVKPALTACPRISSSALGW